ncbi:MAG TPA: hypothetical protein VG253_12780 [Streptosporangiaceae bacterium]|nr:hypothetical protein [Streptosporangiaceae bacterium]
MNRTRVPALATPSCRPGMSRCASDAGAFPGDITYEMPARESARILRPSAYGTSTILQILRNPPAHYQGSVRIHGRPTADA